MSDKFVPSDQEMDDAMLLNGIERVAQRVVREELSNVLGDILDGLAGAKTHYVRGVDDAFTTPVVDYNLENIVHRAKHDLDVALGRVLVES